MKQTITLDEFRANPNGNVPAEGNVVEVLNKDGSVHLTIKSDSTLVFLHATDLDDALDELVSELSNPNL